MNTASWRKAQMFAAKWSADKHTEEPTDAALTEAFKDCVKPPRTSLYPLIRHLIDAHAAEKNKRRP